ncbi:hypothetical protein P7K49_023326 [Saguinus oedipus]|uniref:Uncharacterized protein n=1 Tax=Saguinus oedipus TaxID=9490 RepID=A0ABQ9UM49_SAGOE|nr:hypothetical protein P7K49_023326 [Saguinus oedipus]
MGTVSAGDGSVASPGRASACVTSRARERLLGQGLREGGKSLEPPLEGMETKVRWLRVHNQNWMMSSKKLRQQDRSTFAPAQLCPRRRPPPTVSGQRSLLALIQNGRGGYTRRP